jgi:hypothetical protein
MAKKPTTTDQVSEEVIDQEVTTTTEEVATLSNGLKTETQSVGAPSRDFYTPSN